MKQELTSKGLSRFLDRLKHGGMKATAQRIAVHEAMEALGHACADEVYEWICSNSPTRVTVASVYNTLSQLADAGIYSHRTSIDNRMYFDVSASPHIHIYDRVNHKYRDLLDEKLYEAILHSIGSRRFRGYSIESLDVQFVVRPTRRRP